MATVTVRELRNRGGDVLKRVEAGERVTVTRNGEAVAELVPVQRKPLTREMLLERWRNVPVVDPVQLKADIDALLDPSL